MPDRREQLVSVRLKYINIYLLRPRAKEEHILLSGSQGNFSSDVPYQNPPWFHVQYQTDAEAVRILMTVSVPCMMH